MFGSLGFFPGAVRAPKPTRNRPAMPNASGSAGTPPPVCASVAVVLDAGRKSRMVTVCAVAFSVMLTSRARKAPLGVTV